MVIKNQKQLESVLESIILKALKATRDEILTIINNSVHDYYSEYKPKRYKRTWELKESVEASNINKNGDSYAFTVGFDDEYLTFVYKGKATGLQVLDWFNNELHGGSIQGEHEYWNESLELIGDVSERFRKNLKKLGVSAK